MCYTVCRSSASVQGGNKHDVIALLYFILILALQFPVCFIDQYKNAWASKSWPSQCISIDGSKGSRFLPTPCRQGQKVLS